MSEIDDRIKEKREFESKLPHHKQHKKQLRPPMLQLEGMKPSSWIDDRMPEMLWAVLVVGNVERDEALNFFRHIAKFVQENPDCYDVTMSGIDKFSEAKKKEFIEKAVSWSGEVKSALRALLLFESMPAVVEWKKMLGEAVPEEDTQKVVSGIEKVYWHQSQEATDCRWIKFFCMILGGKMKFAKQMEESVRGVFEYPNYGDLRHVRPFIRASEIGLGMQDAGEGPKENSWPFNFWKECFDKTGCAPEEAVSKKIEARSKNLSQEMEKARVHHFKETVTLRNKLIDHFFSTSKTSGIDPRHEGAFGLALYGLTLFIEIIFYRAPLSITGRMALRSLVEIYITLEYLKKQEKAEPEIWGNYRVYGNGQLKLIYLKLQELGQKISSIEIDDLDHLANEDQSVEFVPINLGHWDSLDLRKISGEIGQKDIYDKFYNYTSGFTHASWGAVRESVYQNCINPLHRLHRIPTFDLPLMLSVTDDAEEITNKILESLSGLYPKFDFRLTPAHKRPESGKGDKESK